MCSTAGEKQVEIYRLRAENAALKEQVAHLEESCISGFYYERVPQFSQGFPNHEVLELVTAKEVQAYVDKIEALQSESAVLKECIATLEKLQGVALIESLRAEIAQTEFRNERLVSDYASLQEELTTIRRIHAQNIAIKDAEIARWKTVPMKYRRMEFNAQLQDENAELSKKLATLQSKSAALVDALESFALIDLGRDAVPSTFGMSVLVARKALAAFKGEK